MGMGMGAVEKAVERSKLRSGGSADFLPGIFWTDDKNKEAVHYKKVIRFLSDDVITCKIYEFVKGGPDNKGRDFFAPASIVDDDGQPLWSELADEKDYFLENNIWMPDFKGKLVPPAKYAKERTVGLAVLREEVVENVNGKRKSSIRDLTVEREWKDGNDVVQKESGLSFGIVKQGHRNFWTTLVQYHKRYDTICDRDYEITRVGNGQDTQYVILPLDVDSTRVPADGEKNEDGTDKTVEQKLAEIYIGEGENKCPTSLKDYIIPKARYETAKEWLQGQGSGQPQGGESHEQQSSTGGSEQDHSGGNDAAGSPSSSSSQSLKEQLERYAKSS